MADVVRVAAQFLDRDELFGYAKMLYANSGM